MSKTRPGRPSKGITFDKDEYVCAPVARTMFRGLAEVMKNWRAKVWERLRWQCTAEEIRRLTEFFFTRACTYSYSRLGKRRDSDERSQSLLSRLCYKVNKGAQDEFCRQPHLAMAFLEAQDEIIEHLEAKQAS